MNFNKLFDLVELSPNFNMAQFGDTQNLLEIVKNQLSTVDGKIDFFDEKDYNNFELLRKNYELIILCDIFDKVDSNISLLKKAYNWLETSAEIILLCKKDFETIEKLKMDLDEADFRSINNLDILDNYEVITAKKIYMWAQ
jgi:hypothetical protein